MILLFNTNHIPASPPKKDDVGHVIGDVREVLYTNPSDSANFLEVEYTRASGKQNEIIFLIGDAQLLTDTGTLIREFSA